MANSDGWSLLCIVAPAGGRRLLFKIVQQKLYSTSQWQQSQRTTTQAFVSHHVNFTEEKYLQEVRSVATCRYTRDPTSHLVESLMVSRKALRCRMEPRRTHKDTVATSVVSNVEDGTRISGGQLGTREGSAPCTQHGEPVGTQESVDGKMMEPSKAM